MTTKTTTWKAREGEWLEQWGEIRMEHSDSPSLGTTVLFSLPAALALAGPAPEGDELIVKIPMDALVVVVAEYVRANQIAVAQGALVDELLGIKIPSSV